MVMPAQRIAKDFFGFLWFLSLLYYTCNHVFVWVQTLLYMQPRICLGANAWFNLAHHVQLNMTLANCNTSNKCIATTNNTLLVTSASLLVASCY